MSRNATAPLKTALVRKLRNDFDHNRVQGLTSMPLIIQDRPLNSVDEPYVYFYLEDDLEVDVTKDGSSTDYFMIAQVVVRTTQSADANAIRDGIVDEIKLSIDEGAYLDLSTSGFNIYLQNVESVALLGPYDEFGATYFQANVTIQVRADFVGLPQNVGPTQAPTFTYSLFRFNPSATGLIERYDGGVITPATTYPSNNNGYNFIDASYSISTGAVGTFANGDYDVPVGGEPLSLDSSLRYEFASDTSITDTLTATTNFPLIDSIRYGAITPQTAGTLPTLSDDTSATYGLRLLSNWNIEYGTVRPHNETITVAGDADQYIYIILDENVTLTQVRNTIGQNVLAQFDVQTIGAYKIYLNTNPIVFDGFSTDFTLIA